MKASLFLCTSLSLAGLAAVPATAQIQVQTTADWSRPGAPAAQPTPPPCPGMAGLEIGQTRTFSFERMALHEAVEEDRRPRPEGRSHARRAGRGRST